MRIKTAELAATAYNHKQLPEYELPEIAIVGRSNVGKSSLINKMVGRKNLARTSSTPGKTQSINFFLIDAAWYLVDLPGYGYARSSKVQRLEWGKLIEGYLQDRPLLRGLIHLVDVRHPPMKSDIEMQEWLRFHNIPSLVIGTKADKIPRGKRAAHAKTIKNDLGLSSEVIACSAETGEGIEQLTEALATWLQE
ncbi:MAG: ribosome biogenesis GTP-binding protein YihA/YsxC [Acidobacteriota bacterium]